MILLIIKSYLTILLSVGIGSLFIFIIGLYFIFRKTPSKKSVRSTVAPLVIQPVDKSKAPIESVDSLRDLSAISGEDVIATQLDLARAYVETGRMQLAKHLLECVIAQGNVKQQQEAQQLYIICVSL